MSIKIENTEVTGWEAAIRGMRNPMNSWDKSDTIFNIRFNAEIDVKPYGYTLNSEEKEVGNPCYEYEIGPNDHKLMMNLAKAGSTDAKYRRMINVTADVTAPLYWWKEYDTYKVGTVTNSCSTMHKIHAKPFELDDFSHEHLITKNELEDDTGGISLDKLVIYDTGKEDYGWIEDDPRYDDPYYGDPGIVTWPEQILKITIAGLNFYREKFLETKDKRFWYQMIQLLPSSYNQRRTIQLNYEVLAAIYPKRKDHKLDEWHIFCDWIESLPYSELITGKEPE